MGEVKINTATQQIIIHSIFFFYGSAANEALSFQIAKDIAGHWNEANGKVIIKNRMFEVAFNIEGHWVPQLVPEVVCP